MTAGITKSELRKVRTIVSLIGQENLRSLESDGHQCVRGLHIYSAKNEDEELALSIWNGPKEIESSRCLFADCLSFQAFTAALEFWKPRYPSATNPDAS